MSASPAYDRAVAQLTCIKRLLTTDRRVLRSVDLDTVLLEVARLPNKRHEKHGAIIIEGDAGGMMMVDFDDKLGYYVAVQGPGEDGDMVLVDSACAASFVECIVGGRHLALPRYMFVPQRQALRAIEYFALHERRLEQSEWRDAFALTGGCV